MAPSYLGHVKSKICVQTQIHPKKSDQSFLAEPLRDAAGLIRQPERNPEDREINDQRELQYLQRKLAALHYEQHERPAVLAKIAQLKAALEAAMVEMEA